MAKTNKSAQRVNFCYGAGVIRFSELEEQFKTFGGELRIFAIATKTASGKERLKYGLFYEREPGTYFDVVADSTLRIKAYSRLDRLERVLTTTIGLKEVSIPVLDGESKLSYGDLAKS